MTIKIEKTDICIRPSSVDSMCQCSYQWAKVFLEGKTSITNSRAAIGTSIHRAAEVMWNEAIKDKKKEANITTLNDAAVEEFQKLQKDGVAFDDTESPKTAEAEIIKGTQAFIDDIVPFVDIPTAVEKRFEVNIANHPIVGKVGGTIDYLAPNIIDDLKTSKRKPTVNNYIIQQSIYKYLAIENGHPVKYNRIQGVVLKQKPEGMILDLTPNIDQAKYLVNNLLDVLEVAASGKVNLDTIFRCNPKYYLCSQKYCAFYGNCPATKRHTPEAVKLKL